MRFWMKCLACVMAAMTMIGVWGCSGGEKTEGKSVAASTQTGDEVDELEAPEGSGGQAAAAAKVGDRVEVADWALVVTGASSPKEAGGASASAGKELVVVEFDLTNNDSEGRGIGQTDFKLEAADGTAAQVLPTQGEEFIFNTQQPIGSKETRRIKIVYEVPTGTGGLILGFEPFQEGTSERVNVALD